MSKVFLVVPIFVALPALAQQATIQGVVTDPSNAFVPAVTVTATNTGTGTTASTLTNGQGFHPIPGLVPGAYRVEAAASGFAPSVVSNLTLNVDQTARVDFALQVGTVAQAVEVSAAAAIIDSETTVVG